MLELQLYGTLGCHLCEVAEQLLAEVVDFGSVQVELIDIADTDEMIERLGTLIPVLGHAATGRELCWPFDGQQVSDFIAGLSAAN